MTPAEEPRLQLIIAGDPTMSPREKTGRLDTMKAPHTQAREDAARRHEEGQAFRGQLGNVCANQSSNAANPELCGTEAPLLNDEGEYIGPEHKPVPESAPTKKRP